MSRKSYINFRIFESCPSCFPEFTHQFGRLPTRPGFFREFFRIFRKILFFQFFKKGLRKIRKKLLNL
jgi:1-acyl-sn-glycerol-3-phosphate acyltransferase